jgi:signal peptidase I
MSHNNDDSREVPPPVHADDERFNPVAPDRFLAPEAPPVEPPSDEPVAQHPVEPVRIEPSWRHLVAAPRVEDPWTLRAPSEPGGRGDAHPDEQDQRTADVSVPAAPLSIAAVPEDAVRSLGTEPIGLREEPSGAPQAPGEAPLDQTIRRDAPPITLSRIGEEMFAWLKTLASAAVYATLIVTFGFQVARVEGQSMAPTLENQDRLIVNKLAYRLGQPQVGDIVMLYYPLNPEKSFVKRVIAEEGDQIRIVDGRVYRNDVPVNDDYVPSEFRSHDDWGPEVVPQGYYFVMGDHRNNSSDSRHWRWVPKKYIIGKVQLRWWPLPQARIF